MLQENSFYPAVGMPDANKKNKGIWPPSKGVAHSSTSSTSSSSSEQSSIMMPAGTAPASTSPFAMTPPLSSATSPSLSSQQSSSGISLDDFKLLKLIGQGSYAKVYLVRKTDNQRVYALKILKKKKIQELYQTERVILERDILAKIPTHPFIIKLHYSFQNYARLFFALDFCPGGELFTILNKRRNFDEEQARFYAAQIILAIEHLHKYNVIYRDLKPENVIIDQDGYIRISDFGLSKKDVNTDQSAFSFCGTPEYLAPEILSNLGHGKPVDWWALGNLIFEMLTGLPPFYHEKTREELFERIRTEEIDIPAHLSKQCKDLLSVLFQKDASKRLGTYGGAEEIKDHPWFLDVDWEKMLNKQYQAPFIPKLKNDTDVSNFDDVIVQAPLNDSYQDNQIYHEFASNSPNPKDIFSKKNFSFVNSLKEISTQMELE